jgi:hypothetical protein
VLKRAGDSPPPKNKISSQPNFNRGIHHEQDHGRARHHASLTLVPATSPVLALSSFPPSRSVRFVVRGHGFALASMGLGRQCAAWANSNHLIERRSSGVQRNTPASNRAWHPDPLTDVGADAG